MGPIPQEQLEIMAAASFFASKLREVSSSTISTFERELISILSSKYANHWHPSAPIKGQAYRSILYDYDNGIVDDVLLRAAKSSGIASLKDHLIIPRGVQLWCDPGEVSYSSVQGRSSSKIVFRQKSPNASPATSPRSRSTSPPRADAAAFQPSSEVYRYQQHHQQQQQQRYQQQQQQQQQMYPSTSQSRLYHSQPSLHTKQFQYVPEYTFSRGPTPQPQQQHQQMGTPQREWSYTPNSNLAYPSNTESHYQQVVY